MPVDYIAFTKPWIEKLKDSTQRDPILATVYQLTQQGWPHQRRHVPCLARRYWDFRDELSTHDGMLRKGPRLIIPEELQEEYLSRLHEGHLSASKVQEKCKTTYVSLHLRVQNGISRLISALCVNCLISIPEYSRIRLRVQNGISCLISTLCVNCLISIPEYSRIIDYSIIWLSTCVTVFNTC